MKSRILIIFGVLALIVALIMGIIAAVNIGKMLSIDVSEEALYTVDAPENVTLEEGDYEIWLKMDPEEMEDKWDDIGIRLFDMNNNSISIQTMDNGDKNIGTYYSYGEFSITSEGDYIFTTNLDTKIFVTEPMDDWGRGLYSAVSVLVWDLFSD